jgi:PleD family two-component response regulator
MREEKQTVLIVDDEDISIEVLSNALGRQYNILVAKDGKEALKLLANSHVELILLDIMMPEMDGFEVCRRLKDSETTREIPVIFMTGRKETEDIVKGFNAGALDYVTKPFNITELMARVKTHLDMARVRESERELIAELQNALAKVKQLSGLLPMCSVCKKVRDDAGYWHQVEQYLATYSDALIASGACPDCMMKHYPDLADKTLSRK